MINWDGLQRRHTAYASACIIDAGENALQKRLVAFSDVQMAMKSLVPPAPGCVNNGSDFHPQRTHQKKSLPLFTQPAPLQEMCRGDEDVGWQAEMGRLRTRLGLGHCSCIDVEDVEGTLCGECVRH